MSLSMHQASAPVFVRVLQALSDVLAKAQAEVAAGHMQEATLMQARLAPDMFPLPRQVQIASDAAKGAMARLAGLESPVWPDEESTLAELADRIARTVSYIQSVDAASVDGSEEKAIHLDLMGGQVQLDFTGQQFLLNFATPNLYFHATTAYDILRQQGVPLGKRDFLGAV